MIARALRCGALAVGGLAAAAGLACNGSTPAPHGSPVLTDVYWIAGDTTALVWTAASGRSTVSTAPPFVDEIDFVFDRRLDGDLVEDRVTIDGVAMTRPKADPPVHVTWPQMNEHPVPGFALAVQYNSVPRYGGASSYVFARPAQPGLPSKETVTFSLDAARLASSYGEPAVLTSMTIDVKTGPLTVTVSGPTAPVAGSFQLPIVFSNRLPPPPESKTSPFFHVRTGGADVPYKLLADASVSSRWYVAPADCLGRWPAGTKFDVVIDPGAPDAFARPLEVGATASFTTGAGVVASQDCGVAAGDGGALDAPSDAALDAPSEVAVDASVTDAPVEAPDAGVPDADDAGPADAPSDAATESASDAGFSDAASDPTAAP